jgi:superfamily II DNA or RNA helicase
MPDDPHMSEYARLNAAIASTEERNRKIVKLVVAEPDETWLILTNRKPHCARLETMLRNKGISALAVTSKLSKGKRKKAIVDFRAGNLKVLIATSLADQGLDIKRMSRCVLALPERAKGRTQQRTGRLMRPFGQKQAKLYDIVDHHVDVLRNRWSTRKSVYRSLGLEILECKSLSLF